MSEQPHSIESERSLLGCLLLGEGAVLGQARSAGLKQEWFYREEYGLVYKAIARLFEEGEAVSEISVLERLKGEGEAEQVGGIAGLYAIMEGVETSTALNYFLRVVGGLYKQRKMLRAARRLMEIVARPGDVFEEVREAVQGPLTELGELSLSEQSVTARERAVEFIAEKEEERAGKLERVPSTARVWLGLPGLEAKFGAIDQRANDNFIVIAAPSSRGKSTLLRQVLNLNLRKHEDWRIGYFLLEGSLRNYLHHSACAAGEIDNDVMLDSWVAQRAVDGQEARAKAEVGLQRYFAELEFLRGALDERLFVFENDYSIGAIEGRCTELTARLGRLDLVVVDYVQVVESTLKNMNREQQMAEVSGRLKRLQKRLGCPVLTGSQLNEDGKARESRAIFNDSTRFWRVERAEKDANGNQQQAGRKQYLQSVEQEKFRNGRTGWASVNFNCAIGRFYDHGEIPPEKRGRPKKTAKKTAPKQAETGGADERIGMGDYF